MSDQQQRTTWALDLFREFIRSWVAPAMQGHLLDNDDNGGERVREAISAIAPQTDDSRRAGWAVFLKEHDTEYDRERPSGYVYAIASAVFEDLEAAENGLTYLRSKHNQGDSSQWVICEVQQIPQRP